MTPSRTAAPARGALLLLALAVAVFLGIGLRAAMAQGESTDLAAGGLDDASYERALELSRDAQRMNPDSGADLLEGSLLVVGGSRAEAARVFEEVAREEPENSKAWALLIGATDEIDPERAREARARLRLLKPPIEP